VYMGGDDKQQSGMFSYISAKQRVPEVIPEAAAKDGG